MGEHYGQLSLVERIEIHRLHAADGSRRSIASRLGRSVSTISRELRRNSVRTKAWPGGYEPVRAHSLAVRRRRWDCRYKLERQPDLRDLVKTCLAMGEAAARLRRCAASLDRPTRVVSRTDRRPTDARAWSHLHQP